jgi:hypothetical protein
VKGWHEGRWREAKGYGSEMRGVLGARDSGKRSGA